MASSISTALANALMTTGGLKESLTGAHIYIYAGTVPANADASLGAATLLCDISGPAGAALLLQASATDGTIQKDATQVWSGTNAATGTATFFRMAMPADTGALSTTDVRIQGDVGTAGKALNLSSVSLTSGATQTIEYFAVTQPKA